MKTLSAKAGTGRARRASNTTHTPRRARTTKDERRVHSLCFPITEREWNLVTGPTKAVSLRELVRGNHSPALLAIFDRAEIVRIGRRFGDDDGEPDTFCLHLTMMLSEPEATFIRARGFPVHAVELRPGAVATLDVKRGCVKIRLAGHVRRYVVV